MVTGEKDTSPFFQVFEYSDESYEKIVVPSVNMIKEKIVMGLKINFNECLALYCNYVVSQLRAQKPVEVIEEGARKILSPHNVMFGVPESLRKVVFYAMFDEACQYVITVREPIRIMWYELGEAS
jgi:urease gamma subunit